MSNMSYCRFRNTASDLRDCAEHIEDDLSEEEHNARRKLINCCAEILSNLGISFDLEDEIADKSLLERK